MISVIIKFPSIVELLDFELTIKPCDIKVNIKNNTISGTLSEADIELAKLGFNATVTVVDES